MASTLRALSNVTLVGIDCVNVERLMAVANLCQRRFRFADVKLFSAAVPSGRHENIHRIPEIRSKKEYSQFVVKGLSGHIRTSHVLIVQHDGFILNPKAWDDRFLAYDYIGAPWGFGDGQNVGNGGFSLRSKRLLDALRDDHIRQVHPEDQIICRTYRDQLEAQGMKFAPDDLAARFSLEGNPKYGYTWNGQFGFHSYALTDLSGWNVFKYASIILDGKFIIHHLEQFGVQRDINALLRKLSVGDKDYPVEFAAEEDRPIEELKESIDRGYVRIRFTQFETGIEIGVKLELESCDLGAADFGRGSGRIRLYGVLDCHMIRCVAEIDLSTLKGLGRLVANI